MNVTTTRRILTGINKHLECCCRRSKSTWRSKWPILRDGLVRLFLIFRRTWNYLIAILTSLLRVVGIVLSLIVGYEVLAQSLSGRVVLIESFVTPKLFEDEGYNSQTINTRVMDEIRRIETEAPILAPERFALTSEIPNFEVPVTNLSLKAVVQSIQSFLRL